MIIWPPAPASAKSADHQCPQCGHRWHEELPALRHERGPNNRVTCWREPRPDGRDIIWNNTIRAVVMECEDCA